MLTKIMLGSALLTAALCSHANTVTVTTYGPQLAGGPNHGWWSNTVANYDGNDNFATGHHYSGGETRSFFTFDLSELDIRSLTDARLELPQGRISGPLVLYLWDVTTDPVIVNANTGTNQSVFDDLGSGTEYGRVSVTGSESMVLVPLNASALDAILEAQGFFTIGASAPGPNFTFGLSEHRVPTLVLHGDIAVIPEPPIAGMLLAGLAVVALRRRKKNC